MQLKHVSSLFHFIATWRSRLNLWLYWVEIKKKNCFLVYQIWEGGREGGTLIRGSPIHVIIGWFVNAPWPETSPTTLVSGDSPPTTRATWPYLGRRFYWLKCYFGFRFSVLVCLLLFCCREIFVVVEFNLVLVRLGLAMRSGHSEYQGLK